MPGSVLENKIYLKYIWLVSSHYTFILKYSVKVLWMLSIAPSSFKWNKHLLPSVIHLIAQYYRDNNICAIVESFVVLKNEKIIFRQFLLYVPRIYNDYRQPMKFSFVLTSLYTAQPQLKGESGRVNHWLTDNNRD